VIAYREQIGAQHIALLTDIQVKYSTLLESGKTLEQSARQAAAAGADAIIVTGSATGHAPDAADLRAAQAAGLPVLIGSGLTAANASAIWPLADGTIVGTALRSGSGAFDRVVEAQARKLVARCRMI
jgi:predicted TIM-barrel enzyme